MCSVPCTATHFYCTRVGKGLTSDKKGLGLNILQHILQLIHRNILSKRTYIFRKMVDFDNNVWRSGGGLGVCWWLGKLKLTIYAPTGDTHT